MALILREMTLPEMREVYDTGMKGDFPPDELKPFSSIENMYRRGVYRGYGGMDGDRRMAYAMFVCCQDPVPAVLMDYLAVSREHRDQGFGSGMLEGIGGIFPSTPVYLESENPEFAEGTESLRIRNRRLDFYRNNGAVDTGIRTRVFGVEYVVMRLPAEGMRRNYEESLRDIRAVYHTMFREEWFGNRVVIHPGVQQ